MKMENKSTPKDTWIYVDVDGTLIDYEDKPRYDVINFLRLLKKVGHVKMVCWSGGGYDYAERWVERLGLQDLFEKIDVKAYLDTIPRPLDVTIDDEEVNMGVINIRVKGGIKERGSK